MSADDRNVLLATEFKNHSFLVIGEFYLIQLKSVIKKW